MHGSPRFFPKRSLARSHDIIPRSYRHEKSADYRVLAQTEISPRECEFDDNSFVSDEKTALGKIKHSSCRYRLIHNDIPRPPQKFMTRILLQTIARPKDLFIGLVNRHLFAGGQWRRFTQLASMSQYVSGQR